MDEKLQMVKQMIQMNKMAFDNSHHMMMSSYDQNKLMFDAFLHQTSDLPPEGKKAIRDWMQAYKKGCQDFKRMLDTSYEMIEQQISDLQ